MAKAEITNSPETSVSRPRDVFSAMRDEMTACSQTNERRRCRRNPAAAASCGLIRPTFIA